MSALRDFCGVGGYKLAAPGADRKKRRRRMLGVGAGLGAAGLAALLYYKLKSKGVTPTGNPDVARKMVDSLNAPTPSGFSGSNGDLWITDESGAPLGRGGGSPIGRSGLSGLLDADRKSSLLGEVIGDRTEFRPLPPIDPPVIDGSTPIPAVEGLRFL